jgi:hypothetical protein
VPLSKKSNAPTEIAFSFDDLMGGLNDALAHGERKPSGAALRLLEIARRAPEALMAR